MSVTTVENKSLVPENGQVVHVRGSVWAVTDVQEQGLVRSSADDGRPGKTHVVSLESLDEDRQGEQLRVIWELEVGKAVNLSQGLPDVIDSQKFDDPQALAGFIDALRWGAVTSADESKYQAPFWSGVNVEAYQLEPLRRALTSPRTNLLLADDVGLGKTIEAGLVIQELLLRHRARTAVIVCPPSLALKWQDEMREKFGLDFTIINSERMAEVRRSHGLHANPFSIFPRVIVSMAWLSSSRAQRMLRDVYSLAQSRNSARRYAFDILVVDEAHHVAPSAPASRGKKGRTYAVDSQRTIATRKLAEHCEHRLFLSATPHNGHSESFAALLEMIDSRRFARGAQIDRKALDAVTVRRLKTDIAGKGFKGREVKELAFLPSEEEQEMFALLDRILKEHAKANKKAAKDSGGDIVALLLKKRFLSSPYALGKTLESYIEAAQGKGLSSFENEYDETWGEAMVFEEEGKDEQTESSKLRQSKVQGSLYEMFPEEVEKLRDWGKSYENRPDSRLEALIEYVDGVTRGGGKSKNAKGWTEERFVVFTEYAETLTWIQRVMASRGYNDQRLSLIQGSTDQEERELIRARFNAPPAEEPVRVLLATDAAGEGIDLQRYCHRLVNFDIPFNPSRLEQRIGRIDRYGQSEVPTVFHFRSASKGSILGADSDLLSRIAMKMSAVRKDLGKANSVIAEKLTKQLAQGQVVTLSDDELSSDYRDGAEQAIADSLRGEVNLNKQLTELERTYDEAKSAMHLEPANLRRVVDTALQLNHQPVLQENFDFADIADAQVFNVPELSSSWNHTLEGLDTRLNQNVLRPITFDAALAHNRTDLAYVHLGHPLVQKSQRMLRSALWSASSPIERVTALVVPGLEESVATAVVRMVLVGKGGTRLHEEVFFAGVRLSGSRSKMGESKASDALELAMDSGSLSLADLPVRTYLAQLWNQEGSPLHERLLASIQQRADKRSEDVAGKLEKRRDADIARIEEIYAAFRRNLEDSLERVRAVEAEVEGQLFADENQKEQLNQWRRDKQAMKDRMDALEGEKRRELQLLKDRFEDVKPHVTAAALVFAVTEEDAKVWGK